MSDNTEPAVIVKDLYKSFKLPHEQHSGLKQAAVGLFNSKRGYETQEVLNDISFEIKKGEFFGIIGRNGSGKSTLLKLLAGIYVPDKGLVRVNGSLTPFIELGVGFNPELTGRENVFLNGALLGFDRREIEGMYIDIVEFAELEKFMDQKLKNYSSGMQVRLAFSIAIRAKSDVLILDEVLAVGDEAFQKKCTEYFIRIKQQTQTVVLVTHDMSSVEKFCDRVLVLDKSKIIGIYDTFDAKKIYSQLNRNEAQEQEGNHFEIKNRWGTKKVELESIQVAGAIGDIPILEQGDELEFIIKLKNQEENRGIKIVVGLGVYDEEDTNISGPNSKDCNINSNQEIRYRIAANPLNPGRYRLEVALFNDTLSEEYDHIVEALNFEVINRKSNLKHGKIDFFGEWNISKDKGISI